MVKLIYKLSLGSLFSTHFFIKYLYLCISLFLLHTNKRTYIKNSRHSSFTLKVIKFRVLPLWKYSHMAWFALKLFSFTKFSSFVFVVYFVHFIGFACKINNLLKRSLKHRMTLINSIEWFSLLRFISAFYELWSF